LEDTDAPLGTYLPQGAASGTWSLLICIFPRQSLRPVPVPLPAEQSANPYKRLNSASLGRWSGESL